MNARPTSHAGGADLLGQPAVSTVLAGTEFWDRISFHGMQALLVLYMVGPLLLPGHIEHVAGFASLRRAIESITGPLLLLLVPIMALFWIAQSQVWNTYNIWARDHLDLTLGHWVMPVPWLQAIDGLAAFGLVPSVVLFWRWQARRGTEPDDIVKLGTGCLIFSASMVWLAAGGGVAGAQGKVPLVWALAFHVIENLGYVFVAPIAVALYSAGGSVSVNAIMVGVNSLSIFVGSTLSGRLGGLYGSLSPLRFWILHAAIVAAGGLLFLLCARPLRRGLSADYSLTRPT